MKKSKFIFGTSSYFLIFLMSIIIFFGIRAIDSSERFVFLVISVIAFILVCSLFSSYVYFGKNKIFFVNLMQPCLLSYEEIKLITCGTINSKGFDLPAILLCSSNNISHLLYTSYSKKQRLEILNNLENRTDCLKVDEEIISIIKGENKEFTEFYNDSNKKNRPVFILLVIFSVMFYISIAIELFTSLF